MPRRFEANAILLPSGDHAGQPSKNGLFVRLRRFEPSPSARKTSEFPSPMIFRKAICFISGDHEPYVLIPSVIRRVIFFVARSTALICAEFFFGGSRSSFVQ